VGAAVSPAAAAVAAALVPARVLAWAEREGVLELDGQPATARLAFSCLVQPRAGDQVLAWNGGCGDPQVLGILERPDDQTMTLALPGATRIRSPGELSVLAGTSLTLAADQLQCVSDRAVHHSREAVLGFGEITAQGRVLRAHFDTVTVVGRMVQTLVRHLIQRTRSYLRATEESDQVQAGQIMRRADGLYALSSQYTVLTSSKDTRIDGERIHMG